MLENSVMQVQWTSSFNQRKNRHVVELARIQGWEPPNLNSIPNLAHKDTYFFFFFSLEKEKIY